MIDRFQGDGGRENLLTALLSQEIIAGERGLAEKFADSGKLLQFAIGDFIVEQDGSDNDVYFLLNGKVDVIVNLQKVGERSGGTVVGEMAALDPMARRSATLKATTVVTALKVDSTSYVAAGDTVPGFWRRAAMLVSKRLREREKFHLPANPTPIMFVGSSVEGLALARAIQSEMSHDRVIVRPWTTKGVFGPSRVPIDDLMQQVQQADFALFVFGPDDQIHSRDKDHSAPRDNVVFEMGMFVGKLGRERVFMVQDRDVDLKIPSDLSGVNPITYKCLPGCETADLVGNVCNEVRRVLTSKGVVQHRMRTES